MAHTGNKRTELRSFVDGAQVSINYLTAIGTGDLSGHTPVRAMGRRSALATTVGGDDIWEGTATSVPFPDQTVGEQLTVVSTSANDTAAGSGAQQIDIHGVRAGGSEYHETITLNGTTPVNSTITDWIFVQYLHVQRVAAIGTNSAGDISAYRTGDAARVYAVIKAGNNVTLNSRRMVPSGRVFYMTYVKASAVDNKPVSVRLVATCDFEGVLTPNIFVFNEIFELENSSAVLQLSMPRMFPSGCIIKGVALSSSAGGTASISYGGWLE